MLGVFCRTITMRSSKPERFWPCWRTLGGCTGGCRSSGTARNSREAGQVWCGAAERYMRNDAHFWATMNYVHNNPVHHGYVERWQDWPFSSAQEYLAEMGREFAEKTWREYPILDYGEGWDDAIL